MGMHERKFKQCYKREDNIDFLYLINENKLLTQSEFKHTLPTSDFEFYVKSYMKKRLLKFFTLNFHTNFFNNNFVKRKYKKEKDFQKILKEFDSFIKKHGIKESYSSRIKG